MAITNNSNKGDTGFRASRVFAALAVVAMLFLGINDAMANGGSGGGGGGGEPPPPPPPPPDDAVLGTFKLCDGTASGESGRSIVVTEKGKTIISRIRCD